MENQMYEYLGFLSDMEEEFNEWVDEQIEYCRDCKHYQLSGKFWCKRLETVQEAFECDKKEVR